jgi:hypothetical protein
MWFLLFSAWAAESMAIDALGDNAVQRLEQAGLETTAIEASSKQITAHAVRYLNEDSDTVVYIDSDGLIRASHTFTSRANRQALKARWKEIKTESRSSREELYVAQRVDQKQRRYHAIWATINHLGFRSDGRW